MAGDSGRREPRGQRRGAVAADADEEAHVPVGVRAWLASLGHPAVGAPLSSAGQASLLAVGPGHVLKLHASHRGWAQERDALRDLSPELGGMAPALVAADERFRALLITRLPGLPAAGEHLTGEAWREVLHAVGQLVARLHAQPVRVRDPMAIEAALTRRARAWLERAARLGGEEHGVVARMLATVPATFGGETRVWCHRDNQARNWLVQGGMLTGVVDFEHARPDHWLADLVKLPDEVGALDEDAVLRAFLAGYGRPGLQDEERLATQWRWMRALHGLATLVRGREDDDPVMADRGRELIASVGSARG